METIVTAAIFYEGKAYTGWRHCQIGLWMRQNNVCPKPYPGGDAQGFMTSDGRFVSRKEALDIARKAGQLIKKGDTSNPNELYSEDLWDVNGQPYEVDASTFGASTNLLYWECERCGHRTPRHPNTKPEEMPPCHQYLKVPIRLGEHWDERARRFVEEYQYTCNGKMVPREDIDKSQPT